MQGMHALEEALAGQDRAQHPTTTVPASLGCAPSKPVSHGPGATPRRSHPTCSMLVSELDQLIHSRSKLFRLYQAAKQGDRTAQEQYVTALTDAVPSVLHLVLMPSCAQTSGAGQVIPLRPLLQRQCARDMILMWRIWSAILQGRSPPFAAVLQFPNGQVRIVTSLTCC